MHFWLNLNNLAPILNKNLKTKIKSDDAKATDFHDR